MKNRKRTVTRILSGLLSAAVLCTGIAVSAPAESMLTAQAAASYPLNYFRLGMADTDANVNASGAALSPDAQNGTNAEKWYVNWISSGVFEIVSADSGLVMTANGSAVTLAQDTDAASQRWKIEGVQKDFDGYDLYYKITSNADSSKSLTFRDGAGFTLAAYSGDTYQKYRLDLDGCEGWAAAAQTSAGIKACTIGGLLGEVVYVSTADDLEKQLNSVGAQTIVITGDIDMQTKGNTRIRDNKTIVGCYGNHTIYDSQFRTNDAWGAADDSPSDNIVFRNLKMVAKNVPNRILINVWSSRQIWIDHIFFDNQLSYDRTGNGQDEVGKFIWINTPYDNYRDAKDRLRSPDYVTISYCHLKKRYWTVAYGTQNDEITRDRTTLLFNWWDENVRRCPQLGNGSAHIYNNYYSAFGKSGNGGGTSGIIGGDGSDMVSENNYFNGYTLQQALMMGGGSDPCRDSGSYLSEGLNATPSKVSFSPKTTSSWYPNKSNYGYSMLDAYNTKSTDSKAFCTAYSGDQTSASRFRSITDSEFASWITTKYDSPFLKHVELKVRTGAVLDTAFSYTFRNVNSGLYLSVDNDTAESGANVAQGKSDNKAAYTWKLQDAGDGYYYIYTALNDTLCIDLPYGSTDNGISLGLWSNDESDARKFKFIDNGDGTYTITTRCTNDQSCFGVMADSKESGADVIQWPCTGNDSQKWYIQMKLEPLTGELMTFDRLDTEHAGGWMIREDLAVGAELYGDREGVTFTQLPETVSGAEYLLTACDGKNLNGDQGELTALQDMTLYVAQDARVESAPAWLSGWTKTDMTAQSSKDVTYILYSREVNAGESILLGTNGQSSGCVNYTVFAVKAASQPAAVRGDADANGTVSITDIIMVQKWLLNAGEITDCQNADMNADGVIDIFDLALLKHLVLAQ